MSYSISTLLTRNLHEVFDRVAGAIKATHPDFRYQPIVGPRGIGQWRADPMGIGPPW
jgi:hypothetical protein